MRKIKNLTIERYDDSKSYDVIVLPPTYDATDLSIFKNEKVKSDPDLLKVWNPSFQPNGEKGVPEGFHWRNNGNQAVRSFPDKTDKNYFAYLSVQISVSTLTKN